VTKSLRLIPEKQLLPEAGEFTTIAVQFNKVLTIGFKAQLTPASN